MIESKCMFINIKVPNVKVSELKVDVEVQLIVSRNKESGKFETELEVIDHSNGNYMGKKLEDSYTEWKKIKDFHLSLGIDLNTLIYQETAKILTEKVIEDIIKKENSI